MGINGTPAQMASAVDTSPIFAHSLRDLWPLYAKNEIQLVISPETTHKALDQAVYGTVYPGSGETANGFPIFRAQQPIRLKRLSLDFSRAGAGASGFRLADRRNVSWLEFANWLRDLAPKERRADTNDAFSKDNSTIILRGVEATPSQISDIQKIIQAQTGVKNVYIEPMPVPKPTAPSPPLKPPPSSAELRKTMPAMPAPREDLWSGKDGRLKMDQVLIQFTGDKNQRWQQAVGAAKGLVGPLEAASQGRGSVPATKIDWLGFDTILKELEQGLAQKNPTVAQTEWAKWAKHELKALTTYRNYLLGVWSKAVHANLRASASSVSGPPNLMTFFLGLSPPKPDQTRLIEGIAAWLLQTAGSDGTLTRQEVYQQLTIKSHK